MRLVDSPSSPFVRKVNIVIHELGIDGVERVASVAHPVARDAALVSLNPLGQVPTLILDDGVALADSRVICEYLNDLAGGTLFPHPGPRRWQALCRQSMTDGALDAAILLRYEQAIRGTGLKSADWIAGQTAKIVSVLDALEREAARAGEDEAFDIGAIGEACLLGYLDFRFPELCWRERRPGLATRAAAVSSRPSLLATIPRPKPSDSPPRS
jgi:glutathione S-transferase